MNHDEFAFFNQQLAGMLNSGIPLEGALRQLSSTMGRGPLREEMEKLEADLARGTPFAAAVAARDLPAFYVQMLQIGAKSNDLPAILTLLADFYARKGFLWMRLKGLMVYPLIVLCSGLALSIFIAVIFQRLMGEMYDGIGYPGMTTSQAGVVMLLPVIVLALALIFFLAALSVPRMRNALRWRLSGFKETSLAYFADTLHLLLEQGTSLPDAVSFLRRMAEGDPLEKELRRWETHLAVGRTRFNDFKEGSVILPPLFFWMIAGHGEDVVTGLARAAEIYRMRAQHRIEMLLSAALPMSVLFLGLIIVGQMFSIAHLLGVFIGSVGTID